jgi:NADP-dependent 3-hydroxy acid dehydrogenase YdfG
MSMVAELPLQSERWQELRDQLVQQPGRVRRTPLPLGNREDPDEELLFILLTLMTRSPASLESTLAAILAHAGAPPWEGIAKMQRRTLIRLLQPVGLVNRRADQLRSLARTVLADHGGSLATLAPLPDEALLGTLESLPGVGRKSARCVAAYAFGRDMLAVDVHVLRVVKRLGLSLMEARWDDVDVLINSAGLAAGTGALQDADPDDWDRMLETNVRGVLTVTRALLPGMLARGSGHVVNIGSIAGRGAYPGGAVYSATKAALDRITAGLRMDVLGSGVRVSSVDPGMVETEFSLVRYAGDQQLADDVYAGLTPLTAADVADAVRWVTDRPPHVVVADMMLLPVAQAGVGAHLVHRQQ